MAKTKTKHKKNGTHKGLSEGKAITVAVLLFVAGLIAAIYLIKFILGFFFPDWVN